MTLFSPTREKFAGNKNPMERNPFATRDDFAQAECDMCDPTLLMLREGGVRLRLAEMATPAVSTVRKIPTE